jgi:hypothetical protein
MDRIILTEKDVAFLLEWRDNHKDLVRSMPQPFRAIKLVIKDSALSIKCIRDKNIISFYPFCNGESLGKFEIRILLLGYNVLNQKLLVTKSGQRADVANIVTVYASLMAYITFGKEEEKGLYFSEYKPTSIPDSDSKTKSHKNKRRANKVTYIFSKSKTSGIITGRRYTKSKISFCVRGHWRTYKNGKRIWVKQFTKGAGKKKDKNYKLGGHKENE